MAKLSFKLVTPERTIIDEKIDSLTCPTTTGQITILPGHIPLISNLEHGELVTHLGSESKHIAVSGGFVEVRLGNEVVVLADTAEHAAEIDIERAEEARRKALALMETRGKKMDAEEHAQLAVLLQRNLSRINVARKHAHRRHGNSPQKNIDS